MGRGEWYRWDKKNTVDQYFSLPAHHVLARIADPTTAAVYPLTWKRGEKTIASLQMTIDPQRAGVTLAYNYEGEPVPAYLVRWDVTIPRYGGQRYWWLCPRCGRRCATLYGGSRFLCRLCQNLTYVTAQTGDRRVAIDNRMLAIRRRLDAHTGGGWPLDPLPEKPPRMHWATYHRLAREYCNLAELRGLSLTLEIPGICGWAADSADSADSAAEYRDDLQTAHADYRRKSDHEPRFAPLSELPKPAPDLPEPPERFTLGELAARAGVSFAFAKEAQQEGLLRPDAGRTQRAKRYRGKLATRLRKLHELREAGLTWGDLRAWSARRFTPGHEHERRYPAGYVGNVTGRGR